MKSLRLKPLPPASHHVPRRPAPPQLQLAARAAAVADFLSKLKLGKGDRVILSFPPGLKFLVTFVACISRGIIAGGCSSACYPVHTTALPSGLGRCILELPTPLQNKHCPDYGILCLASWLGLSSLTQLPCAAHAQIPAFPCAL